jgi:methionyl-tRNA formyltransferase
MRVSFVGAVEGSQIAFDALIGAGHVPALLVTLPMEAALRHSDFVDLATPARARDIKVHTTTNINAPETLETVAAARPDITLVIGWSQICRQAFRDIARIGTIGFHPAALPRLRGRGVIPWTILRDETSAGSTLFWLDEGVDSGDILLQRQFALDYNETARSLYDKHTRNLSEMIPQAVSMIAAGNPPRTPQDETMASYCARRRPEDGVIDWHQPASAILRLIRAVGEPYPGAYTLLGSDQVFIDEATAFPVSGRYIGLVGQVQAHTADGFLVLCGDDECIEVRKWRWASAKRPPVHCKFNRMID